LKDAETLVMKADKPGAVDEVKQNFSYFQLLAMKIVDNLEISISNIHIRYGSHIDNTAFESNLSLFIRYEDSIIRPNCTIAAGITIETMALSTTDENWVEKFVVRDNKPDKLSVINKLWKMENFSIYCTCDADRFESMIQEGGHNVVLDGAMRDMITYYKYSSINADASPVTSSASASKTLSKPNHYVLAAPNYVKLKMTNTKLPPKILHEEWKDIPKTELILESDFFEFCVDKVPM
jgi:hypothetical protein